MSKQGKGRSVYAVLTRLSLVAALILTTLLGLFAPTASAQAPAKVKVLISFLLPPGPAEQALVRGVGGDVKYTYHLVPAIAATVPEAALAGLRQNPLVTVVEPDIQAHIVDAELDSVWGVKRIGSGTVHATGNKGTGVKVGILDTGIDLDHPDLAYDPACSASFVAGETLDDGHGHGTHVAGTIAGLDNGSGVVGVAPEATLCIYKVMGNSGSGSYSDIIAALERAVADGVQITNNSYGSSGDPGTTVRDAFDKAYAAGVLHVAAAGNYGTSDGVGENCIYPARWGTLVATGATTQSDVRAYFSSTCPEVELAAPGYTIYSTIPGGGYGIKSGTSMASPHAAGAVALVRAARPAWSNAEVRARLQATADDLGDAGRDAWYGYGLVDADEAAGGEPSDSPVADGQTVSTDEDTSVQITLTGSEPNGGSLTYRVVTGPSHGALSGTPPSLTYTPAPNYSGSDSFTFVANNGQVDSNIATVSITVRPINDPPSATFRYSCTGLSCSFDASGSSDTEGAIAGYNWNYGDGQTGSGLMTSHTFAAEGSFNVILTVIDNGGVTDTDTQSIALGEGLDMHLGDLDGVSVRDVQQWQASVTVTVHDANHGPVANATVNGAWSGDWSGSGSCVTSAGGSCVVTSGGMPRKGSTGVVWTVNSIDHDSLTYSAAENHDPEGDSSGVAIHVSEDGTARDPGTINLPPVASFTHDCLGLTCSLDASGVFDADGSVVEYAWDFGDGTFGSGISASHTYGGPGGFAVQLRVRDDDGATDSALGTVIVSTGSLALTASGYKLKGIHIVDLRWDGASSIWVDIYRDDEKIFSTLNLGVHTDITGEKGWGLYTYQVCEAGSSICSNKVTVDF